MFRKKTLLKSRFIAKNVRKNYELNCLQYLKKIGTKYYTNNILQPLGNVYYVSKFV